MQKVLLLPTKFKLLVVCWRSAAQDVDGDGSSLGKPFAFS